MKNLSLLFRVIFLLIKIQNENVDKFEAIYEQMNKEEDKLTKLYEKEERVNEERIGKNWKKIYDG